MPINPELMALMGGQAMGPAPEVTPGQYKPFDWDLLAMMLGRGAQAFSAEEPTSWQHQLGGAAAGFGESRKFAKAATRARGARGMDWEWLRSIMGGTPTPQGMEGVTSMKVGRAGEGKLPEITLGLTPGRDVYDELFGGAGEGVSPGLTEPIGPRGLSHYGETPESIGIGGAGGRSAEHPFFRDLPEVDSRQPIW